MDIQKMYRMLEKHVPANAVHHCVDLWHAYPFSFRLSADRRTKFGDYRYDRQEKSHRITVNASLNPYAFLITYIHEVAHRIAFEKYGHRIKPHGIEWKNTFKEVFEPALSDLIFPQNVLVPLRRYMKNPKASSYSDHRLALALQKHDDHPENKSSLAHLPSGARFMLSGKIFEKGILRRSRVLCKEVSTGRNYLVSISALVEKCA